MSPKKYHSHITLNSDSKNLSVWCSGFKGTKLTDIVLTNYSSRVQLDKMVTTHYVGGVVEISEKVYSMAENLRSEGYKVLRVKLENDIFWPKFSKDNYGEVHIKLKILRSDYNSVMKILKENFLKFGYRPSGNPREQKNDFIKHFINMRFYDGTKNDAERKLLDLSDFLNNNKIEVLSVHKETTVFDTFPNLDGWWIG